ncbi:serine/threonine-protein kinase [Nocardia sp. AG03]|uniref:serine/threonine-protein kinase n=1 Tax=Nocardia sp. AG03 TaxID=3025312 RepID=UPI0024189A2F|nr:serine/threonine-protein kinase [Nocardia sp. AG03]
MISTGTVFAGYTIDRQLGQGGMGSVFLARHPRLPRQIALKVLNPELFADTEIRARFEREADLAAQLEHPNIVTVYDRGVDDGRLWISMQFVDGTDAATLAHPVPVETALHIIEGTAAALDHAHRSGILHRDVKPANILLTGTGGSRRVLLADFGIARPRDDAHHLTRTGTFTATLAFAAPEQLTGADLDHRTDQYALACTLYSLLTGVAPYEADNPVQVIQGHLQSTPPSPRTHRPDLPAALDAVLARALAKRPGERYDSCAEFAAAARSAVERPGGAGNPLRPAHPASAAPPAHRPQHVPSAVADRPQQAMIGAAQAPRGAGSAVTPQGVMPAARVPQGVGSTADRPHGVMPAAASRSALAASVPQGHPGFPSAPPYPVPRQPYPAPPRRRRRWPIALVLISALVIGAGVWAWRDDTGFLALQLGRSRGHQDLNAMAAAFPGMLPDSYEATDGHFGTTCRAAPSWKSFYGAEGAVSAFDGWQARWECLSPDDSGFAYRFYSYRTASAADKAVTDFVAAAQDRGTSTGPGRLDRKVLFRSGHGVETSTVVSQFTDPARGRFVLFTIPRFTGDHVEELAAQVATAPL